MKIRKIFTSSQLATEFEQKEFISIAEPETLPEEGVTVDTETQVVTDMALWKASSARAQNAVADAVVIDFLKRIEDKVDKHDIGTSKDHGHMSTELKKLREENDFVKKQLSEMRKENLTIINCIKFNATKNIQSLTVFGIAVSLCSLLISALLKIHLINPFLALLMSVASGGFYLMTKVEEKLQRNGADH